jgi:hypothetical protein
MAFNIRILTAALAASAAAGAVVSLGGRPESELLPPHMHPRTRTAIRKLVRGFPPASSWLEGASTSEARTLTPSAFGAATDCSADASPAFDLITQAFSNLTVGTMSDGIKDLGGVVVDLQGGCYLLSRTWSIPQFYANLHITHGELRADPSSFAANATLVQVGSQPCNTPSGQGESQRGGEGTYSDEWV